MAVRLRACLPRDQVVNFLRCFIERIGRALLAGEIVAGAVHSTTLYPPSGKQPPEWARLRAIGKSHKIEPGPMVVRADLPRATRDLLAGAMLSVHKEHPEAASLLAYGDRHFTLVNRSSSPTLKTVAAMAGFPTPRFHAW